MMADDPAFTSQLNPDDALCLLLRCRRFGPKLPHVRWTLYLSDGLHAPRG